MTRHCYIFIFFFITIIFIFILFSFFHFFITVIWLLSLRGESLVLAHFSYHRLYIVTVYDVTIRYILYHTYAITFFARLHIKQQIITVRLNETILRLPVYPAPQYRRLQKCCNVGNWPNLYTTNSPQFLTFTRLYQKQQLSSLVKQTMRSTTPSPTVGWLPFSHPGDRVPQWSLGTHCEGIPVPARPVNLYQVWGKFASHFNVR